MSVEAGYTVMPAEQFDEMVSELDDPTPIPELVALASAPRRVERR